MKIVFKTLLIALILIELAISALLIQKIVRKPNIILMIGDGMGVTEIYAGMTGNHGTLNLEQFEHVGFSKTYSASDYTTDSGAGATAISTGQKTFYGAIAVDVDSLPVKTILEYAEEKGLSTGLVSTSSITDATPASFISHNKNRYDLGNIALDFLKTDVDVFIGGGKRDFAARRDSLYLIDSLRAHGYQVFFSMDSISAFDAGKIAGLTANSHNVPITAGRGDMLGTSTQTALRILNENKKGFFLMVEGSHIDKQAHLKIANDVVQEMIDFDQAIGIALEFAKQDKNTLVIVTADHETSGMSIVNGDFRSGEVTAEFSTTGAHTGVMVPVFAYGPGAYKFHGIQENTDLFYKMMEILKLTPENK